MVQDSRSSVLRHAQIRDEQSGDDLLKSAKWSRTPIAVVSGDTLHAQARNRFRQKSARWIVGAERFTVAACSRFHDQKSASAGSLWMVALRRCEKTDQPSHVLPKIECQLGKS
jgi:hypothetical protein